jgi:transposase
VPELETDPLRMAAIMLGLRDVNVLGIDEDEDGLVVDLEPASSPPQCPQCGKTLVVMGAENREVPGHSAFGRPTVLSWRLRRFRCNTAGCPAPERAEEVPPGSAGDDALKQ